MLIVVAPTEAEHRECDPTLSLLLDELIETLAGHADVKVTVSAQDDAVESVRPERVFRQVICGVDPARAVSPSAGSQATHRFDDGLALSGRCRHERGRGAARVGHDRYGVGGVKIVEQETK